LNAEGVYATGQHVEQAFDANIGITCVRNQQRKEPCTVVIKSSDGKFSFKHDAATHDMKMFNNNIYQKLEGCEYDAHPSAITSTSLDHTTILYALCNYLRDGLFQQRVHAS
jgi:hypothetical protein